MSNHHDEVSQIQRAIEADLFGDYALSELPVLTDVAEAAELTDEEPAFAFFNARKPRRPRSLKRVVVMLCILCTLGTGTLGVGLGMGFSFGNIDVPWRRTPEVVDIQTLRWAFGVEEDIGNPRDGSLSDLARLVNPFVVSVDTYPAGQFLGGVRPHGGTGIAFDESDSYIFILTRWHVVDGATRIMVRFSQFSPRNYLVQMPPLPAVVVATQRDADLAVLAVAKSDLERANIRTVFLATWGDSETVQVGDTVMAVGNAMGDGNTTTVGVVSAIDKTVRLHGRSRNVLQTDAAINPGGSGGPLVNLQGEVIGINTVTDTHSEVEGMNFSTPVSNALNVLNNIMQPRMGIMGGDVGELLAEREGIPQMGVIITSVPRNTGAERAGIQAEDIITSFDGQTVHDMNTLQALIAERSVGDTVEILLLRSGRRVTTQLTLGGVLN